jgi:hypothetical protein
MGGDNYRRDRNLDPFSLLGSSITVARSPNSREMEGKVQAPDQRSSRR